MRCQLKIASLLVLLLLLVPAVGAQEVKLKAALQTAVTRPIYGVSMVRFKEEVERRSGGAISIQIFDKSQLAYDDKVVDAVRAGIADIGTTAIHNFAKTAPAVSVLDVPFLFNFKDLMAEVAKPGSEIRTLIDDAILAQTGVRVLFWQSLGDMIFFSKGRRDVADVARLKGQRVAVPGKELQSFIEHCGGQPSAITVEKFHDALKNGEVDMASMLPVSSARPLRLVGVTDTITYTGHGPVEFLFVVNESTWQSLTSAHQAVMIDAAQLVERETRQQTAKIEADGIRFALEQGGFKIEHLTHDQVAEWRACSAEMLAEYMERNGELARRLMVAYAKLRLDPCCTAGPGSEIEFTRH